MKKLHIVVDNKYDENVVHLTYLSMLDRNINSGNIDDLTHEEVEGILKRSDRPTLKLYADGEVVAIAGPCDAHPDLIQRIGLNTHKNYRRLGFIYVHPDHTRNGYGDYILKWFCESNDDVLYICSDENIASYNLAKNHLCYLKRWYNLWRLEYWHVFVK